MDSLAPNELRTYLQLELARRCSQNSRYSLRAFAQALHIEPSALSKILTGKRGISRRMFDQLADRLELDPALERQLRGNPFDHETPTAYRTLEIDHFHVVSDWYHCAILEATALDDFQGDPRWIAKKLKITVSEVNIAVERLVRLEMLSIDGKKWKDESGAVTTVGSAVTSVALRKMQKQILQMAVDAIEEVPAADRDHSSMTMAGDSRTLPAVNVLIRKFRRELCALLQSGERRDAVYNLGIALYPITASKPADLVRRK